MNATEPAKGDFCQVLPWGSDADFGWLDGKVEQCDLRLDLAVVSVPGLKDKSASVLWGKLDMGSEPVRWEAIGFPVAGVDGAGRQPESAWGDVSPATERFAGRLGLVTKSRAPRRTATGSSGWAGLSGAAVFCNDRLVGVIIADAKAYVGSLIARRVECLADNPVLYGAVGSPVFEAVSATPTNRNELISAHGPNGKLTSPSALGGRIREQLLAAIIGMLVVLAFLLIGWRAGADSEWLSKAAVSVLAFASLLAVVFAWHRPRPSRSVSAPPPPIVPSAARVQQRITATLSPTKLDGALQALMIRAAHNCCSICHRSPDVDVYRVEPDGGPIVLCAACSRRAGDLGLTAELLMEVRDLWLSICRDSDSAPAAKPLAEQYNEAKRMLTEQYNQASRLALSTDLKNVREALMLCRRILVLDPFHTEAQLLAEKLEPIERRMQRAPYGQHGEEYRMWDQLPIWLSRMSRVTDIRSWRGRLVLAIAGLLLSAAWLLIHPRPTILEWLTVAWCAAFITVMRTRWILLPLYLGFLHTVMIHESSHLIDAWLYIRNDRGRRMPFLRCFRYVELDIDGQRLEGGVREAISRFRSDGRLPSVSSNIGKMQIDWYLERKL